MSGMTFVDLPVSDMSRSTAFYEAVGREKAAGATADPCPTQDYGFMYGRSFEDPDGHIWEVMWMDAAAAAAGAAAFEEAGAA